MTTYADLVKQAMEYLKPVDPTLAGDVVHGDWRPLQPWLGSEKRSGTGGRGMMGIDTMTKRPGQFGQPPDTGNVVPLPIGPQKGVGLPLAFFQQLASNNPDMLRGMTAQDPQAQAPPEPPPGNPPPIAPIPLGQKMFRERGRYPRGNPIPGLEENQIGPGVQP